MTAPTDERAVPLIERLRSVPKDARFFVEEPTSSRHYPVGHLCHEAADALAAQPVGAVQPMTEPTPEAAEAFFAALGSDHPLSTLRDEMVAAGGGAVQPPPSSPEPRLRAALVLAQEAISDLVTDNSIPAADWIERVHEKIDAALAAPPSSTPEPLTDERITELWSWAASVDAERTGAPTQQHAFARVIEAEVRASTGEADPCAGGMQPEDAKPIG